RGKPAETAESVLPAVVEAPLWQPLGQRRSRHVGVASAAGRAAHVDDTADTGGREQLGELRCRGRAVSERPQPHASTSVTGFVPDGDQYARTRARRGLSSIPVGCSRTTLPSAACGIWMSPIPE